MITKNSRANANCPKTTGFTRERKATIPSSTCRRLELEIGDFILFDSFLPHCTHMPTNTTIKHQLRSLVFKISMAPAALRCALERTAKEQKKKDCSVALDAHITEDDVKATPSEQWRNLRLAAYMQGSSSTHWSYIDAHPRMRSRPRHQAHHRLIPPNKAGARRPLT